MSTDTSMPRKALFMVLGSVLLLGVGFLLGRMTAPEPSDEEQGDAMLPPVKDFQETTEAPDPLLEPRTAPVEKESPVAESPRPEGKEDPSPRRPAVVPLASVGADGRRLREGVGVPVRVEMLGAAGWLVPQVLIDGAVGLVDEQGRAVGALKVLGRSRTLRLAVVGPVMGDVVELAGTAPSPPVGVWVRGAGRAEGVPTEWIETSYDEKLGLAVGVLDVRGCGAAGGAVFDRFDRLLGLVPPEGAAVAGESFLPVGAANLEQFERTDMSLVEFKRLFFDETAAGHLARARRLKAYRRYGDALVSYRDALARDPGLRESVGEEMRECHWARLDAAPLARAARRRALWLDEALGDFPNDGDFHWERMRAARALRDFARAVSEALDAQRDDPEGHGDIREPLAELHLSWAKELAKSGRIRSSLDVVDGARALGVLSGELARLEGDLLLRLRDYQGAIEAYREAMNLDGSLAEVLWPEIRRAERFTAGPGRMLIDYPPGSRSVVVQVTVNGVGGDFILDTGATSTMVPVGLARRAGLDLSNRIPKVKVKTAGSERILPYTPTRALGLGPLEVTGLSVIVGDLPGLGQKGLLGMDFLSKFRMENDPEHGRMVLSTR